MEPLERSYLIQRLTRPATNPDSKMAILAEAFSFGGGMRSGGLTKQAMDLLRPIFGFDYMGSAEFEFGAVPQALTEMAKQKDIQIVMIETLRKSPIWIVCDRERRGEITIRVLDLIDGKFDRDLKESTYLQDAMDPHKPNWFARYVGWLELDNAFAFFIDEETAKKFHQLFTESKT